MASGTWSKTPGLDGRPHERPTVRRRRSPAASMPRPRVRVGGGLVGSVVIHGLLVLAIFWAGARISAELRGTGRGLGPAGGGGGGGGPKVSYIELPPLASAPAPTPTRRPQPNVEPPPEPEPIPTPVAKPIIKPALKPALAPVPLAAAAPVLGDGPGTGGGPGSGPGTGGGEGSGVGTGIGSHVGPGTGGGGPAYAPEPRAISYPIDAPPASIQGREYTLHFWVDATGRVTRVEIDPPLDDGKYRKKLLDHVSQWIFYPARTAEGNRVEGEIVIAYRP